MHRDYRIDIQEVEISQLDLRYAYTRIQMPDLMARLSSSIERFGQTTPVVCVLEGEVPLVLLDGYRRVAVLKRLGRDIVWAQVWHCQVYQALAEAMVRNQERRWEALEEGALIQELCRGLGLTQSRVAEMLGRDKSWVARRVALIEALPEDIIELVRQGHITPWAATRVLVPLARANHEHARGLCNALLKEHLSTRQLYSFWRHYQQGHHNTRERMVEHPVLFIRSLEAREEEKYAGVVREGPEGRWIGEIKRFAYVLYRLRQDVERIIYPGQGKADRLAIVSAIDDLRDQFYKMESTIRRRIENDYPADSGGDHHDARKGGEDPSDKPDTQGLKKHGTPGVEGGESQAPSYLPTPSGALPHGQGAIGTLSG